jgi:hypothetical protein
MIAVKDMETTDKQEILEAISGLADHMYERFMQVDRRFERIEGRLSKVESDLTSVKSHMVTKDYLDKRLTEFRGETVAMVRRLLPSAS